MPINNSPDKNTYMLPEVSLQDTFNAWRDISNLMSYKLNKLTVYSGVSSDNIDTSITEFGKLSYMLKPVIPTGHTFSGGIAGTTAQFTKLLTLGSGLSCGAGATFAQNIFIGGGTLSTNSTSVSLFNSATSMRIGMDAVAITMGAEGGNVNVRGSIYIGGAITIQGGSATFVSQNVTVNDPVLALGYTATAPTDPDGKARGIQFHHYKDGYTFGFFGFNPVTEHFVFYPRGKTTSPEVFAPNGATGTFSGHFLGGSASFDRLVVVGGASVGSGATFGAGVNIATGISVGAGATFGSIMRVVGGSTFESALYVGGGVNLAAGISVAAGSTFGSTVAVLGGLTANRLSVVSGATFGAGVNIATGISVGEGATFGHTIRVVGGSTFESALYVGGGVNLASTLNVASGATFGGGIRVATGSTFASTVAVLGGLTANILSVLSGATFGAGVNIATGIIVGAGATFGSGIRVVGGSTFDSTLYVAAGSIFAQGITANSAIIQGALSASNLTISSGATFGQGVVVQSGISASRFYAGFGSTFASDLNIQGGLSLGKTLSAQSDLIVKGSIVVGSAGGITAPNIVNSINGVTGTMTFVESGSITITRDIAAKTITIGSPMDILGVTGAIAGVGISLSGVTGVVVFTNTGVTSFNGNTGAVVGASLGANTFTLLNTFNAGISASGATFIGNITATGATFGSLAVTGQSNFGGAVTINGNLLVGGTMTTVSVASTTVAMRDNILALGATGGGAGITGDSFNDRGVAFFYNNTPDPAEGVSCGFFGMDITSKNFVYYQYGGTAGVGSTGGFTGTIEANFKGATATFDKLYGGTADFNKLFVAGLTAATTFSQMLTLASSRFTTNANGSALIIGGVSSGFTGPISSIQGINSVGLTGAPIVIQPFGGKFGIQTQNPQAEFDLKGNLGRTRKIFRTIPASGPGAYTQHYIKLFKLGVQYTPPAGTYPPYDNWTYNAFDIDGTIRFSRINNNALNTTSFNINISKSYIDSTATSPAQIEAAVVYGYNMFSNIKNPIGYSEPRLVKQGEWVCLWIDNASGSGINDITFDVMVYDGTGFADSSTGKHFLDLSDAEIIGLSVVSTSTAFPATTHATLGYTPLPFKTNEIYVGATATMQNVRLGNATTFTPNINSGNAAPKFEMGGGDLRMSGLGFLMMKNMTIAANQTVTIPVDENAITAGIFTVSGTLDASAARCSLVVL